MFASLILVATTIGLTNEQEVALEALIASRQAARAERLEKQAAVAWGRMQTFYAQQAYCAAQRKIARQQRLAAAEQSRHQARNAMVAMQAAAISAAYRRQLAPVYSLAAPRCR